MATEPTGRPPVAGLGATSGVGSDVPPGRPPASCGCARWPGTPPSSSPAAASVVKQDPGDRKEEKA